MNETVIIHSSDVGLLVHADIMEETARKQVEQIASHPAFRGLIAIMPDVHAGAGCVIGFTGKFRNAVIPNIVGVDIGCGVAAYPIGKRDIDFAALDEYVRKCVPLGFKSHPVDNPPTSDEYIVDKCKDIRTNFFQKKEVRMSTRPLLQLGTLGGGNHFIEIDESPEGERYITVHTGSRNFGLKVALYYQGIAKEITKEMGIEVPDGLEYLPMSAGGKEYMKWLKTAQWYARVNRRMILSAILGFFKEDMHESHLIESTHNYISERDHIVRKGAISAYPDERLIIPLNMSEGIILGRGKANPRYNFSAPHGAGRAFGRREMKRRLDRGDVTMEQFHSSMDGIFSTSVKKETIDESMFAYKPTEAVLKHIEETVDIDVRLKPIYNLKAD